MLTSLSLRIALAASLAFAGASQAPEDITGRWVGSIDTDQGQMEIAVELAYEGGKYSGEVKSAHGGWPVTSVTSKDGLWTIAFGTAEQGGTMKGRITDRRLRGDWTTHMATGTFDLVRPRRQ